MPDDERSLAGVRVLVTRAADRSDAFAELLRERGAEPVAAPLIELHVIDASEELDAAAASLPAYDFVAFTSAAAVAPFLLAMAKRNASVAPHSKVVAVGPTTAAALEAARFPAGSHDPSLARNLDPLGCRGCYAVDASN